MESAPCRQWFLEITMPHKAHHRKGCLPPFSWRYTSWQRRGKNSRKRGRSQQSSFCRNPTIKNTNINQYQISVRVPILGVYTMIHHALSGIGFGFLGFNRHHRPQLYQQLKRVGRCHGPHGGYMREWCWNLGCPKYIKISNNLYKLMIVYDSLWSLVIASPIKKRANFKGSLRLIRLGQAPGSTQLLRLGTVHPSVKKDSALEVIQAARDSPSLAPWPLDATQKSVPGSVWDNGCSTWRIDRGLQHVVVHGLQLKPSPTPTYVSSN